MKTFSKYSFNLTQAVYIEQFVSTAALFTF